MSARGGGPMRLQPQPRIDLQEYPVDACWTAEGGLVVAGGEGTVKWLAPQGTTREPRDIGWHAGGALAVAAQKAGRLFVSSGQDGAVALFDTKTLESRPIHRGSEWCEHLAFADNGRALAVAGGRTLHLFDDRGELLDTRGGHPGAIGALAWRPKALTVAAAGNGGVRLHAVALAGAVRGADPWQDYAWKGACLTAGWNADGRILASGMQDGSVHLWNIASGTQSQMQGYGAKVALTDWSANGRYLATAAPQGVIVWDFSGRGPEGSTPLELRSHSERITALRFRPVGTWLVTAARDRRLLLWRVGAEAQPLDAHLLADECTLLRFSRDGAQLAVGDAGGGITIFHCDG